MNKIEVNELLDAYGGLLTDKQQEICRYYYRDDLSYQEIAEIMHITRSAVYDMIRRCRDDLNHYESILKIRSLSKKREHLYQKIEALTDNQEIMQCIHLCRETESEGGNYE